MAGYQMSTHPRRSTVETYESLYSQISTRSLVYYFNLLKSIEIKRISMFKDFEHQLQSMPGHRGSEKWLK